MDADRHDVPSELGDCFRTFVRFRSPRQLLLVLMVLVPLRVLVASWRWWDLVVLVVLILIQPVSEWLIHVRLLHVQPTTRVRRVIFDLAASGHHDHHREPGRLGLLFVDTTTHVFAAVFWGLAFTAVLRSVPLGLTGGLTVASLTLIYEWMHFLPHTRYVPRSALVRAPWRVHRLHHYRNENYWYGICTTFADHLLGTFKTRDEVPLSPTCRDLSGEVA